MTEAIAAQAASLPFTGGWALFLGYELAGEIEPQLQAPAHPASVAGLRAAHAVRAGARARQRPRARSSASPAPRPSSRTSRARPPWPPARASPPTGCGSMRCTRRTRAPTSSACVAPRSTCAPATSTRRTCRVPGVAELARQRDPGGGALRAAVRTPIPRPFAALAQWQGVANPQLLARAAGAGRGAARSTPAPSPARARAAAVPAGTGDEMAELAAHPKERAEHIMLIDLERNDLGRVCEPGSVRVDELMTIESYAHVHHIVSNVSGRAARGRHARRRGAGGVSGRHDHRVSEVPLHADHRRARGRGTRRLHRLARLPDARRRGSISTS